MSQMAPRNKELPEVARRPASRFQARRLLLVLGIVFGSLLVFPAASSAQGAPTGNTPSATPNSTSGGVSQDAVSNSVDAVTNMLSGGAVDAMDRAIGFLNGNTAIDVNAGWFTTQKEMLKTIGIWVMIPLLIVAAIHAMLKGSLNLLLKSFLVYLPVSLLGAAAATQVVQLLINMTDDFAMSFQASVYENQQVFFKGVGDFLTKDAGVAIVEGFLAVALMIVCVMVYVVLMMREASVYIATAFLPLGFAMLVWPATARYMKKLVEFLFAMIFSKVVMMAGVSIALASVVGSQDKALTGGQTDLQASTVAGLAPNWYGVGQTLEAVAMFALVAFAPTLCMRLIGNLALDQMAQHVASLLNRPDGIRQLIFAGRVKDIFVNSKKIVANREGALRKQWAASTSHEANALEAMGVFGRQTATGTSYALTAAEIQSRGITDAATVTRIEQMSRSNNANEIGKAHMAIAHGANFRGFQDMTTPDGVTFTTILHEVTTDRGQVGIEAAVMTDIVTNDPSHRPITKVEPSLVRSMVRTASGFQVQTPNGPTAVVSQVRVLTGLDKRILDQNKNLVKISHEVREEAQATHIPSFVITGEGSVVDKMTDTPTVRPMYNPRGGLRLREQRDTL